MEPFNFDDVFVMSEILDKTGVIVDLKSAIANVKTDKMTDKADVMKLGKGIAVSLAMDALVSIAKNMHKAQPEIKKFISMKTGKTAEEVGKMSLKEIKDFFNELAAMDGLSDFFKQAAGSIV